MVKILEKSGENREREVRFLKSVDLAQKLVDAEDDGEEISFDKNAGVIALYNGQIIIDVWMHAFYIKDPTKFYIAHKLAELYEREFDIEQTLEPRY